MKTSRKIAITGIVIACIIAIIGLSILFQNISNIKYTTVFGSDITEKYENMEHPYIPYSGFDSLKSSGNKAVLGIGLLAFAVVIFLVAYSISNSRKLVEHSETQNEILSTQRHIECVDTSQRLEEINNLLSNGLISEEEYTKKRAEIISKI